MNVCSFPGCNRPVFVRQTSHGGLCNGHYAAHKRGKPLKPLREYTRQEKSPDHEICPFPDCGRYSWHKHGYCQTHQRQLWAKEELQPIRKHLVQSGNTCSEPGCDKPSKSRGYCSQHYRQDWGVCILPGCGRRMHNKKTGYCNSHYTRYRAVHRTEGILKNES
jgi:hypothetical protein